MRPLGRYEVATSRLGPEVSRRLEEGFTRLCKRPKGVTPMDTMTFQEEVLTPYLEMVCCGRGWGEEGKGYVCL